MLRLRLAAGVLSALLPTLMLASAEAENEGLADLDKATEEKLEARNLNDLGRVINRLQAALNKGLEEDHQAFAESLLA